jgi:prepilin-type N-terminal cleavage/methylation domain-containing protein
MRSSYVSRPPWLPPGADPAVHHQGVTLLEVLVAIFITGVGLLALLTLFPLGLVDLAQAIKDDRQSQLHDVADKLVGAAARLETSTQQVRGAYATWLQQQHAPVEQVQAISKTFTSLDDELASISEEVRSRLPSLTGADRKLATRVLHLIRNGRSTIRALQQNLRLIRIFQQLLDSVEGQQST